MLNVLSKNINPMRQKTIPQAITPPNPALANVLTIKKNIAQSAITPVNNVPTNSNITGPEPLTPAEIETLNKNGAKVPDLLQTLLEKPGNRGVFFGDMVHQTDFSKKIITDHMDKYKKSGVTRLFIEMFEATPETQKLLDGYYNAEKNSETEKTFDKKLRDYLNSGWGKNHGDNLVNYLMNMVAAAKAQGIKVVGIDEPNAAGLAYEDGQVNQRLKNSNPIWVDKINNTMSKLPKTEKYIVFGGAAHGLNTPDGSTTIKSVPEMLGIPSVLARVSGGGKIYPRPQYGLVYDVNFNLESRPPAFKK
jgi:hypothetical protein